MNMDELIASIREDPEKIFTEKLSEEQLLELRNRLAPYAGAAALTPESDTVQTAAFSLTNLSEDYMRRLTMTSLVSFVYQMCNEWTVPAADRRWTPAKDKKAARATPSAAELLEKAKECLRAAEIAASEAAELARIEKEETATPAEIAEVKKELALVQYKAADALRKAGASCGLEQAYAAAMAYPEFRSQNVAPPEVNGQIEMPADVAKKIVTGFLDAYFTFDPSIHVRAAASAKESSIIKVAVGPMLDPADPTHITPAAAEAPRPQPAAEHAATVTKILSTPHGASLALQLIRMPGLADALEAAAAANATEVIRYLDPRPVPPSGLAAAMLEIKEAVNGRETALALLRDQPLHDAIKKACAEPEAFLQYLAPLPEAAPARLGLTHFPPADTFHRWVYYTQVNYEELRTVTEALYPERANLDFMLAIWKTFEGTRDEVTQGFEHHCERFRDTTPAPIKSVDLGRWTFIGDFKKNRENINFYNSNTEVLKRILDQKTEDEKLGRELMRNRVHKAKAENIAATGADAAGLGDYRRAVAASGGAKIAPALDAATKLRLERAKGNLKAAKELEYYEECVAKIRAIDEVAKTRALTAEEFEERVEWVKRERQALEQLEVPEGAVQVDAFVTDGSGFQKTSFYTKADE